MMGVFGDGVLLTSNVNGSAVLIRVAGLVPVRPRQSKMADSRSGGEFSLAPGQAICDAVFDLLGPVWTAGSPNILTGSEVAFDWRQHAKFRFL